MEKLIYYRGTELITKSEWDRIKTLWGIKPYMYIEEHPVDHNYGTGLADVTNILAFIQCDRVLNERESQLRERISKKGGKLTPSSGYYSTSVEHNLLQKLIVDAKQKYNVEVEASEQINNLPWAEFYRLFNLPYKGILTKVIEQEKLIDLIPEPKIEYEFESHYPVHSDSESSYKHYYIKWNKTCNKFPYKEHPYVGKVHYCSGDGYVQIYVYDQTNRDLALQHVLNWLHTK